MDLEVEVALNVGCLKLFFFFLKKKLLLHVYIIYIY